MPKKAISVLLADDHAIVRQGLRMLIEANEDIEIVGEAKTGREAVQLASEFAPDVVVMDIAMPRLNGIQATQQLLKISPRTKVLILSAHCDPEYVEQIVESGASGYLLKQNSGDVLAEAIRSLKKGQRFFTNSIAKDVKTKFAPSATSTGLRKKGEAKLTSREVELLQLIAEGLANKQIASELKISIKTVEKHRQHLMEKLGIHEIAGLTRFAIATGIVESRGKLSPED